jgi:hypothetical protein
MNSKVPLWRFPNEATMNTFDHTNSGVKDGDLCSVDAGFLVFLYVEADTAWRIYPVPSTALGTASQSRGSTNTRIRRWSTQATTGTDLSWVLSSTNGDAIQVAREGIFTVSVTYDTTGGVSIMGINAAAALNNTFDGVWRKTAQSPFTNIAELSMSWTGKLAANDLIWVSTGNALASGGTSFILYQFQVTKWGEY